MSALKLDEYMIKNLTGRLLMYSNSKGSMLARCKLCIFFEECKKSKNVNVKTDYCQHSTNMFVAKDGKELMEASKW